MSAHALTALSCVSRVYCEIIVRELVRVGPLFRVVHICFCEHSNFLRINQRHHSLRTRRMVHTTGGSEKTVHQSQFSASRVALYIPRVQYDCTLYSLSIHITKTVRPHAACAGPPVILLSCPPQPVHQCADSTVSTSSADSTPPQRSMCWPWYLPSSAERPAAGARVERGRRRRRTLGLGLGLGLVLVLG